MRKIALILCALFLVFTSFGFAEELQPVAEVASIKGTLEVKKEKENNWAQTAVKNPGYVYDEFKTDADSVADLEFLIGGHVGINKNTVIEITGEREAKDITKRNTLQKIVLKTGAIWAKFKGQDQTLKFQTHSGVLAIKGTEFVIEEKQDSKETEISVLEGEVAYNTANKQVEAKAGDKITIPWKDVPVVHHYKPEELRTECQNKYSDLYESIKNIIRFIEIAQAVSGQSIAGSDTLYYGYMAAEVINNPNEAVKNLVVSQVSSNVPGPFGSMIGSAIQNNEEKKEPPKPDFPSNLSPDQTEASTLNPSFSWDIFEGADSYWIFVSPQEDMKDLYWAEQIFGNKAEYPAWAKTLQNNTKYFWRLIASKGDKPLGKASQTFFTVNKTE